MPVKEFNQLTTEKSAFKMIRKSNRKSLTSLMFRESYFCSFEALLNLDSCFIEQNIFSPTTYIFYYSWLLKSTGIYSWYLNAIQRNHLKSMKRLDSLKGDKYKCRGTKWNSRECEWKYLNNFLVIHTMTGAR